jgi:hypothetical protein
MESELFLEALLGTHFPEGNDIWDVSFCCWRIVVMS